MSASAEGNFTTYYKEIKLDLIKLKNNLDGCIVYWERKSNGEKDVAQTYTYVYHKVYGTFSATQEEEDIFITTFTSEDGSSVYRFGYEDSLLSNGTNSDSTLLRAVSPAMSEYICLLNDEGESIMGGFNITLNIRGKIYSINCFNLEMINMLKLDRTIYNSNNTVDYSDTVLFNSIQNNIKEFNSMFGNNSTYQLKEIGSCKKEALPTIEDNVICVVN